MRDLSMTDEKGFSLVEVLFGVMIFAFGMLGVGALLTATVRDNSFSSNLSEATLLAANQLDVLLAVSYDSTDPQLTEGSDADGADGIGGIDDVGAKADGQMPNQGKNGIFNVYWNVVVDAPVPDNKTINVIVQWGDQENGDRRVSFRAIRGRN